MKQFKLLFVMMAAVLAGALTSCSDDNDTPDVPAAKSIEGTYKGDLVCTVMGSAQTFEGKEFVITANDETMVSVSLPAFGEAPMALPAIKLPGVKVSEADGVVTLATTEVSGQTEAGKAYTCTLSGTVEGKKLDIKFNLRYGAMPMPLICTSTATKE